MTTPASELSQLRNRLRALEAQLADAASVADALQRVRDEIHQMRDEADWGRVVEVLERQLKEVVDCYSCGLNLLDLEANLQIDYFTTAAGLERHEVHGIPAVLREALETGAPVYRRTRAEIDARGEAGMRAEVRSVIDVPFSAGTVAINHTVEAAFDDRDIDVLVRFARVVDEGLLRLGDLQELRAEVEERRNNEARLEEAHRRLQETQAQLLETETLRVLVEAAGGAAHEISQPLQVLAFGLDRLTLRRDDPDLVRTMVEQVDRINAIVRSMASVQAYRTRSYPGGGQIVRFDDAAGGPAAEGSKD